MSRQSVIQEFHSTWLSFPSEMKQAGQERFAAGRPDPGRHVTFGPWLLGGVAACQAIPTDGKMSFIASERNAQLVEFQRVTCGYAHCGVLRRSYPVERRPTTIHGLRRWLPDGHWRLDFDRS